MVFVTTTGLRADGSSPTEVPDIAWAIAAGTANAITAAYDPENAALTDGLILGFRASAANTTATPTFTPDGLTSHTIVKHGGAALVAGDIPGQYAECLVRYNLANTRWELLNPAMASSQSFILVTAYGATGDGTTDDTAAIQAAIAATPQGGTLYFPVGTYRVVGSGSQALLMTNTNIHWEGEGWGSWVSVDTNFPNTRDIVAIVPTASSRDWSFSNMRIGGGGNARGRNVFHVDATDNAVLVYFMRFNHMLLDAADTAGGGYSFRTTNASGSNAAGGLAYSTFEKCAFDSVYLDYVGDGIVFRDNTFDGTLGNKIAFSANNVTGAANLIFEANTMATYPEGLLSITGLLNPQIIGNWLEQSVNSTNANGAMMDISGSISTVVRPIIERNTIAVNIGITGITAPIRIGDCLEATIDNNYIDTISGSHVVIVNSAGVRTLVRSGGTFRLSAVDTGVVVVSDSGTNTITPYKQILTPVAGAAKLGGSGAGWVIDADNALPFATLPASQTSEVLLVPLQGLQGGDTILTVAVLGQIESAGGAVTGTLDVRKATAAAADFSDASLGTDAISVTADTLISTSNFAVIGLAEIIDATEVVYVTITMTTAASTDVVLGQIFTTVYRK